MNDKTPTQSSSLLQRLGGEAALNALVGAFYFNLLRDDRVTQFFADVDVHSIRNHQHKFLATALGGDDQYRGRNLREAHRSLVEQSGLNQIHFDAMTEILASTLSQFGHATDLSQAIVERVNALSNDVLGVTSIDKKSIQHNPTE